MNTQEILERVKTDLSAEEKTHLALELIDDAGSQIEVAQLLESERRMEDIRAGRLEVRSSREAMDSIREELGIVRPS